MQRITIALDDALVAELDAHLEATGGTAPLRGDPRSGAARPVDPAEKPRRCAHCYGVISCAIDQSVRNLAARVPQSRLDRHDQTVAALSVPLDHSTSIDVAVMRGRVADVSSYAEALFLERGVMHGTLGLIPVAEDTTIHVHEGGAMHAHYPSAGQEQLLSGARPLRPVMSQDAERSRPLPFSPCGRRWREAPDEGGTVNTANANGARRRPTHPNERPPPLPDALAVLAEQQQPLGVEAGVEHGTGFERPVVVGGNRNQVAAAEAGIGVGLAAQMLDQFDLELRARRCRPA